MVMIDYYYEFDSDYQLDGVPVRYGFQRGMHPEWSPEVLRLQHNLLYQRAVRVWAENANGMTLIREQGRDVHERVNHRVMTWIKLQAHDLAP
jgi:hypothetical protein